MPDNWKMVYSSLAIILVTIFVGLCSYCNLERGKLLEIGRSFKEALDFMPGATLFDRGTETTARSAEFSSQMAQRIALAIYELLRGRGIEDQISLKSSSNYVSITMADSLLFQERSAEITEAARPVLKNLGKLLGELDISMRIEGHIDDSLQQIENHWFGWELSSMRAINVMRFFQREANISAERITAAGFSQYRPFVPNRTNEDRDRNRRVEIIIPVVQALYERQHGLINKAPPSFKIWDLSS